MIGTMWTGKARALVLAVSLLGAAVLLAMAAPVSIANAALGSEWRCSKAAFILTTCRQASIDNATQNADVKKSASVNRRAVLALSERARVLFFARLDHPAAYRERLRRTLRSNRWRQLPHIELCLAGSPQKQNPGNPVRRIEHGMRDHRARCDGAHPATPSRQVIIY
jgi:uncharacterized protein (DUF1778 family)